MVKTVCGSECSDTTYQKTKNTIKLQYELLQPGTLHGLKFFKCRIVNCYYSVEILTLYWPARAKKE